MKIHPAGSRPTRRAPQQYFTGAVWQDPIIATEAPARIVSTLVSFEPGARTAWHSHDRGQLLMVEQGRMRAQKRGEPIKEYGVGEIDYAALAPGTSRRGALRRPRPASVKAGRGLRR